MEKSICASQLISADIFMMMKIDDDDNDNDDNDDYDNDRISEWWSAMMMKDQ